MLGYTSYKAQGGVIQPGAIIRLEDPAETALSGTGAQATYAGTGATVYQTALHEIGHALGLGDDADPNSVMSPTSGASNQTLDQTDIAGIKALYDPSSSFIGSGSPAANSLGGAKPASSMSSSLAGSVVPAPSPNLNQLIQAMASFGSPQGAAASSNPVYIPKPPEATIAAHPHAH